MTTILKVLISAAIAFFLAKLLPGISIQSYKAALVVVIILGILNFLVKPILVLLTFPITVLTLGAFLLVINAGIIMLDDAFVHGFKVTGFWAALVFSVCYAICTSISNSLFFSNKEADK
jgi:putative membrane protein